MTLALPVPSLATIMPRLLPPVLLLISMIAMATVHRYLPGIHFLPAWTRWPGLALLLIGIAISAWHARLFRRRGTNIHTFRDPDVLVTEGMFRFTRNPMYLGFALALAGMAAILGSTTPFIVLALFIFLVDRWYIRLEERAMLRQFGDAYRSYRQQVRRWL
jgi:protein-S-isoprenylcysteine O-methyltransferase Ste14